MTLSTNIYVDAPITQRELFEKVNDLLGIPKERIEVSEPGRLSNRMGQGFPAIVDTHASLDGSLMHGQHDDDCEEDCTFWRCLLPAHRYHIDLDTGYAYRDENGGCTVLHARVIVDLFNWLEPMGGSIFWVNEYSGALNVGITGIEEFLGNGDEAHAWFVSAVLPILKAATN